jgi:hypothetical protein
LRRATPGHRWKALYGNQAGYVGAVTAAANSLVAQRFLLQRDADLRVQQAAQGPVHPDRGIRAPTVRPRERMAFHQRQ